MTVPRYRYVCTSGMLSATSEMFDDDGNENEDDDEDEDEDDDDDDDILGSDVG